MPAREEPPQGAHAFQELQVKYFNSKATLKHVVQQLQNTIKTGRRAALTLEQLNSMADVSNTYVALGKTYFLTPKSEVVEQLSEADKQAVEERQKLLDRKEVIEKQIVATEKEIRELLQHSPALAQAIAARSG